ncbi:DUF2199 domain-containing protein [Pseudooceanicola algae]|uniref:DUF2199 domain-containing protein n=1 Tax=Pseudooceanicola algae TaxID=1537215 RepID=A0A418SF36_9RHOB|nr:DUF2199 domain-containing protein [Pseudooceanicola algae]QPM89309.1 hypothetical protein PSAL_005240 [Pseudooceanicola algae]
MSLLSLDARWRRFNDPDFRSPIDGRAFSGLYDLGFDAPDAWPHGPRPADQPLLEAGADRLSAELCRIGEARYLRAVIALPLRGTGEILYLAPWVQVAPADFYAWIESTGQDGATPHDRGPEAIEGLLANALPGFPEDEGTALRLMPAGAERPRATALAGPLSEAITDGISFDDLLDLYAAAGDDIRPHISAG